MVGKALGKRRKLQQPALWQRIRVHICNLEYPFGKGPGLVKNDNFGFRERFQIIAAFNQNPSFGSASDSAEKAEWDRDHQCTGAGDDKED